MTGRARARVVLALAALGLAACYRPEVEPCRLACNAGTTCPAGLTCGSDGYCTSAGMAPCLDVDADVPFTRVAQLAAGAHHACAIAGGRLWCWGDDARLQLGAGTEAYQARPVEVELVPGTRVSDWTQVTAGIQHTCARRGGDVYCWGGDSSGEVAVAAQDSVATPTLVTLPTAATDVCAGGHHSCAVAGGVVYCWGDDSSGQRGDGDAAIAAHMPRPIASARTDWADVECGEAHTCARAGGDLYCWGDPGQQRLGRPATTADQDEPTTTAVAVSVSAFALGRSHTCAITTSGLRCWGTYDQSNGHPSTVIRLPGALAVSVLSAGGAGTCAGDGTRTYCWGGGGDGEGGDGTFANRTAATAPVQGLPSVAQLASGDRFHCAIDLTGRAWCWGRNSFGQLATGVAATGFGPTRVGTDTDWDTVTAGTEATCGISTGGALRCWGRNLDGEVGDRTLGPVIDTPRAVAVSGQATWRAVGVGQSHACAVTTGGAAYCWGDGSHGRLGRPADGIIHPPTAVTWAGVSPVTDVATAARGSCVLGADATRICWGDNTAFALGLPTAGDDRAPTVVGGVWSSLALGEQFGCATDNLGQDVCWGSDGQGQRGDGGGETPPSDAPLATSLGGPNAPADVLTAGSRGAHACAIHTDPMTTDTALHCWGDGNAYALGTGSSADARAPVAITEPSATGWSAVAAGARATCAVASGALYCWGTNDGQQLGVASVDPVSHPRMVDPGPGWRSLTMGDDHACAIKDGALYCWGESRYGAIGVAGAHAAAVPVAITIP